MNQYKHIEEHVSTSPTSKTSKTMSGGSSSSALAQEPSTTAQHHPSSSALSHHKQHIHRSAMIRGDISSQQQQQRRRMAGSAPPPGSLPSVRDFWLPPKKPRSSHARRGGSSNNNNNGITTSRSSAKVSPNRTSSKGGGSSSSLLSPSSRDMAHRHNSRRSSLQRPPPVRPEPDPDGFLVANGTAPPTSPSSTLPSNFSQQQQQQHAEYSSYLQQRQQMHKHQQFTHPIHHHHNSNSSSTPAQNIARIKPRPRPKKNRPWLQDNTNYSTYSNSSSHTTTSSSAAAGGASSYAHGGGGSSLRQHSSAGGGGRPQYQVGRRSREAWKNLIGGGAPKQQSSYRSLNTPHKKSRSLSQHLQSTSSSSSLQHQQHPHAQPYDEAFGMLSSENIGSLNVVQEEDDESSTEATDSVLKQSSSSLSLSSSKKKQPTPPTNARGPEESPETLQQENRSGNTFAMTTETTDDNDIIHLNRSPTDEEETGALTTDDYDEGPDPTSFVRHTSDTVTLASLGDVSQTTEDDDEFDNDDDDDLNNRSMTSLDSSTDSNNNNKSLSRNNKKSRSHRRGRNKVQRTLSSSSDEVSGTSADHAHRIVQRGLELAATLRANYKREQQTRKEEQMLIYQMQRESQEVAGHKTDAQRLKFSLYQDDPEEPQQQQGTKEGDTEDESKTEKKDDEPEQPTPQSLLISGLKERLQVVHQGDEHVIEQQGTGRRFLRKKSAAEIAEAADREVRQRRRVVLHSLLRERLKRVYQGHHYIVETVGKSDNVDSILDRRRRKQEQEERDARAALLRMQLAIALQDRLMAQEQQEAEEAAAAGRASPTRPKLNKPPPKEVEAVPPEDDENEDPADTDEEDDEDDVSVLSMGEQSVATVQSLIVAATVLNHQKSIELAKPPIDAVETAQAAALRNTRTQQKQQMQQFLRDNEAPPFHVGDVEDDEQSEWDEQTYYSQQQHSAAQHMGHGDDEQSEWDEVTYHSKMTNQLSAGPQHTSTDEEDDDDDRTEWDEYTYHSKMTQHLPSNGNAGAGTLDQFLQGGGTQPPPKNTKAGASPNPALTVEGLFNPIEWTPRKQMAGGNNRNPLSMSATTLPASNAHNATETDTAGDPSAGEKPTWTASAAESVAEALLSLPGTLLDLPKRHQNAPPGNLPDGASYYDEETLHEYDEATYYDDYEGAGDDDDYWDDHTIATVADAFVTLPKNIQMEFLLSSRNANEAAEEHDDDDSSKPFEEDEPVKENDKNKLMSSTNTSSTASDSWHHDAKSATGSEGIHSFCSSKSLEDLLHKDLIRPDTLFVEATMRELSQNVKHDAEYRASVIKASGVLALVRAMEHNVANPDIQIHACHVLESLARNDNAENQNKLAIADLGGVEAVIGALANYMELTALAEAACACLLILLVEKAANYPEQSTSEDEPKQQPDTVLSVLNIEVAVVDVLVSCMKLHPKNVRVQECNFRILTRLCLDDKEKLIALSQFDGFVIMSASLSTHWDNAAIKQEAITSLSTLFAKLATYQAAGEL